MANKWSDELDVSKLEDIMTVEQFVNMMKRAKAFA